MPDASWVAEVRRGLPESLKRRYHLYPYLHREMAAAFVAADVVICRAGASTLGELPAVGAPSILVPYPHSGAHQWANARYLAEQGAALIVPDEEVGQRLVQTALNLLNDSTQRASMAAAARNLARPQAARAIAQEIEEVSHGHH